MGRSNHFNSPLLGAAPVSDTIRDEYKAMVTAILDDEQVLVDKIASNPVLKARYLYNKKTGIFSCKEKGEFERLAHLSTGGPAASLYQLIQDISASPNPSMTEYLSESDLIQYSIALSVVHDEAMKHHETPNGRWFSYYWQPLLDEIIKSRIHTQVLARLQLNIDKNKKKWSKPQQKIVSALFKKISDPTLSLNKQITYCRQLTIQLNSKPFSVKREDNVFDKFSPLAEQYDYDVMINELAHRSQPMLYYPQTDAQQAYIQAHGRHCYYIDHQTKELVYIRCAPWKAEGRGA
jgi:hypothetical protein